MERGALLLDHAPAADAPADPASTPSPVTTWCSTATRTGRAGSAGWHGSRRGGVRAVPRRWAGSCCSPPRRATCACTELRPGRRLAVAARGGRTAGVTAARDSTTTPDAEAGDTDEPGSSADDGRPSRRPQQPRPRRRSGVTARRSSTASVRGSWWRCSTGSPAARGTRPPADAAVESVVDTAHVVGSATPPARPGPGSWSARCR